MSNRRIACHKYADVERVLVSKFAVMDIGKVGVGDVLLSFVVPGDERRVSAD